ncbi:MAG: DUF6054 family protein [Oscillospiraceae bacterium]|jgi:hypothetical protein|nr:DUF6054 family protein [Oscillospiraceae bacterium]
MASIKMQGRLGAVETANRVMEGVLASGVSCELVDSVVRNLGGISVYIMVFEKYYMRASNRASLTVVVTGDAYSSSVDAIGSGGGQGAVFKFSYGAENSFVSTVEQVLTRLGFSIAL